MRLEHSRLIHGPEMKGQSNLSAIEGFLINGVKYSFPAERGSMTRYADLLRGGSSQPEGPVGRRTGSSVVRSERYDTRCRVPWKEAKKYWDELLEEKYEWSSIGKQLREKGLVI